MRYLLDTHTLIWIDNDPERLSAHVKALVEDETNTLYLSMASAWEMQIKLQLGKLTLPAPLDVTIANQRQRNGIRLLTIDLPHVLALSTLPDHHRDPFDRLLIA